MPHVHALSATAAVPHAERRVRRWLFGALMSLILALGAGLAVATGYFGGAVFHDCPAQADHPGPPPGAAVFLSGDMGPTFSLAHTAIDRLVDGGVPVVSVNSLAFFRRERTSAEVRPLVVRSIRRAVALSGAERVVLIGQSFGADSIPLGLADLPPVLRGRLAGVILIVPATTYELRASPSEVLSWLEPEHATTAQLGNLRDLPVVCLQGVEEADSLCPELARRGATVLTLPGGHQLKFDGDGLADHVQAAAHALLDRTLRGQQASEAAHGQRTHPAKRRVPPDAGRARGAAIDTQVARIARGARPSTLMPRDNPATSWHTPRNSPRHDCCPNSGD